ncbi:unnamed protein product [Urochloa humidicola]
MNMDFIGDATADGFALDFIRDLLLGADGRGASMADSPVVSDDVTFPVLQPQPTSSFFPPPPPQQQQQQHHGYIDLSHEYMVSAPAPTAAGEAAFRAQEPAPPVMIKFGSEPPSPVTIRTAPLSSR